MKQLLVSLWLAFLFLSAGIAYAQGPVMEVSPPFLPLGGIWPGTSRTSHLNIRETGGIENLTGISLSKSGNVAHWVSLSPSYIAQIDAGGTREVAVNLTVPGDAHFGEYTCMVTVQGGGFSSTVTLTFQIPIMLELSPRSIGVSITEEQDETVELTLRNICDSARIYDISFSADDGISEWLILPSPISSLGKGATSTKEVKVRVPGGESKPIGKHSGVFYAQYRGGPPSHRIATTIAIKVLPQDSWFEDRYDTIDSLPRYIGVYQIIEPYIKEEDCITTKEALHSMVDMIKEDPSHFYSIIEPFLKASTEGYTLASDLVVAFEGWLADEEPLNKAEEILQRLDSNLKILGQRLEEEERPDYKEQMLVVYENLEGIKNSWEEKIHKEAGEVLTLAQREEQTGKDDYSKGQKEPLLYPSRGYYSSGKKHFEKAAELYLQTGHKGKAEDCKNRAAECAAKEGLKNEEIQRVLDLAQSEEKIGEEDFKNGENQGFLIPSRDYYSSAKGHFATAAGEYLKLGTSESDDKAKYCEGRRKESENREGNKARDIKKTLNLGSESQNAGQDARKEGQEALFPLNHYNTAKGHFQQAYNLYHELGGDEGRVKIAEVEALIGEVEEAIKGEKIKLGMYSLVLLIVIVFIGRRYLHMMSIRGEIADEKSLFRE